MGYGRRVGDAHDERADRVRLRVFGPDGGFSITPDEPSAQLDALLDRHDAETFVFLALVEPKKRRKKRRAKAKRNEGTRRGSAATKLRRKAEKKRLKLDEGDWREGEIEAAGEGDDAIPAVYALDVRRDRARLVADKLGVKRFFWARRGEKLEVYEVDSIDSDEAFDFDSMRAISSVGRRELARTLLDYGRLGESSAEVGSNAMRLASVAALVVGGSIVVAVLTAMGLIHGGEDEARGGVRLFVRLATHPMVLPPLAVALYLRRHLVPDDADSGRELTRDEARRAWHAGAPHMLAVWGIVAASVVILTAGRLGAKGELTPVELVDDSTTACLVAFWMLSPLTYARDMGSAIGECFEVAITVVISVFVLRLTMIVTRLMTLAFWAIVGSLLPFVVPDWIKDPISATAKIGADLFLFAILLGYAWEKAREHFARSATARLG